MGGKQMCERETDVGACLATHHGQAGDQVWIVLLWFFTVSLIAGVIALPSGNGTLLQKVCMMVIFGVLGGFGLYWAVRITLARRRRAKTTWYLCERGLVVFFGSRRTTIPFR